MESDRISQTLAARIVFAQPVISPEIFNYHPRETPLRSLLLFCTPLRRSWNVARRSKGPQRNMAVEISRACTTFVYSNGIYNGTIIYARQRVPRPLDGAGVTSCSSWGEGERNRGFTASLGDTQKKRPVIPIKKYRAANCEYLWRYDVARPPLPSRDEYGNCI